MIQENTAENRRKAARVSATHSIYVVINTQPQTMGQMVEVSSSGLAFTFVDLESASKRLTEQTSLRMDLFAGGQGHFIKDLPCRIVSKIENVSTHPMSSLSIKRVGVAFEALTLLQQVHINRLVRRQSQDTQ
jgi:c-di-GMP-binding flagellar brake protein YcgR